MEEDHSIKQLCLSASCKSVRSDSMDSEFDWQTQKYRNCFYEGYRYEAALRERCDPSREPGDDEQRFRDLNLHSDTSLPRAVIYVRKEPCQTRFDELALSFLDSMELEDNSNRSFAFLTTGPASRLHSPPTTSLQARPDGHGVVDDSGLWASKNKGRSVFIHVTVIDALEPDTPPVTLELHNCFVRQPLDEVLPQGSIVRLKAPILTLPSDSPTNDFVVRVDHPSDIEVLYQESDCNQSAQEWKNLGDESFRLKRFHEAVRRYTQAIRFEDHPDIRANRSAALLQIGRYDECITDCENILRASNNFKAIYRRAKAAYLLQDYWPAIYDFQQQSSRSDSRAVKKLLEDITTRRKESSGFYDWPALIKEAKTTNYLDCASFRKSVQIRSAGLKGRGIFATEDIEPGTVIVVEKAEAIVFHQEEQSTASVRIDTEDLHFSRGPQNEVGPLLCQAICDNPSKKKRLYNLDQGLNRVGEAATEETSLARSAPEGINGHRMYSVFHHNAFATDAIEIELSSLPLRQVQKIETDSVDSTIATGVWNTASYFNHSCLNNCTRLFLKNIIIVKTNRRVRKDEELTLGYVNKLHDYLIRDKTFEHFGFNCDCELCELDSRERKLHSELVKSRRRHLEKHDYSILASACGPPITIEQKKIEHIPRAISVINFVTKSYQVCHHRGMQYLFIKPYNNLLRLYLDVGYYDRALETARRMQDLVGTQTMDDLVLGLHTLIPALLVLTPLGPHTDEEKIQRAREIEQNFKIVNQAWKVRGLLPGFEGYWEDFGEWWMSFVFKGRDATSCMNVIRTVFELGQGQAMQDA